MNNIRCCFSKFENHPIIRRSGCHAGWLAGRIRYYSIITNFKKNLGFILEHLLVRHVYLETGLNNRVYFERNPQNSYAYSQIYRTPRRFMFTNEPSQYMGINQENSDVNIHLSYKKELVADIKKLNAIAQVPVSEASDLIIDFMSSMGKLFLLYYQFHLNEAHTLAREDKAILEQAFPFISNYGIKLENFLMGTFEDFDEWDRVCIQRTNIEAVNAMFGEMIGSIDVEDIEDCMQQRKSDASISSSNQVPPNTPKSHWWWWN